MFRANFRRWIWASIGAALLTWLMLKIAFSILPLSLSDTQQGYLVDTATALTVFAPLALAVVHVLQTALYRGLAARRPSSPISTANGSDGSMR